MNRLAGIIVAVIGLLIAVLSIAGILPGFISTGIVMILLGALVIGLSFIRKPDPQGVERMSTPNTLLNIFISPTETFQNLRRHPRWLAAVLIMTAMSAIFFSSFLYRLTPERVTNFSIDKALELPIMNEQARKQTEATRPQAIADAKNPLLRIGQAVNGFTGRVYLSAFMAIIFFIFALAMGGKMNYWQAFSAAVYAGFPFAVVAFVISMVVLFLKDPADVHPVMGLQGGLIQDNLNFLVTPSKSPVIYTLLSFFGLLTFYWLWLNATGIKNGGENVTSSTAWTATLSIFAALVLLGLIAAFAFPGFIS